MYERGYVAANDGNVSVRLPSNRILTTPSGACKGTLSPQQLIVTDFTGKCVSGKGKPSSEIRMHIAAYQQRPDVNAVIHAHPPISTAFSIAGVSMAQCILPEVLLSLGCVPTTDYATPTTAEGPEVIRELILHHDALILDRHGTLTVGGNLNSAYMKLERVEHAAQTTLYARQLGQVNLLSKDQVKRLFAARQEMGLKPLRPGCSQCGSCLRANQEPQENQSGLVETIVQEILKEQGRQHQS